MKKRGGKVQLATLRGVALAKKSRLESEIPLKPSDVAVYCQVSKSTVLKWIKDGKMEAFKLPSGHYRVDKQDFRSFLERYSMPIKRWFFESEP